MSKGPITADCVVEKGEEPEQVSEIINMIRTMHVILVSSHIISHYLESEENDIIVKLLRTVEIFTYLGSILYQ